MEREKALEKSDLGKEKGHGERANLGRYTGNVYARRNERYKGCWSVRLTVRE
jgi:hypothetical protein